MYPQSMPDRKSYFLVENISGGQSGQSSQHRHDLLCDAIHDTYKMICSGIPISNIIISVYYSSVMMKKFTLEFENYLVMKNFISRIKVSDIFPEGIIFDEIILENIVKSSQI